MLPYLENLHFPSPPGSSGGSPLDEGGGMVIKQKTFLYLRVQIFCNVLDDSDHDVHVDDDGMTMVLMLEYMCR